MEGRGCEMKGDAKCGDKKGDATAGSDGVGCDCMVNTKSVDLQ